MSVQVIVGGSDRRITMRIVECSFIWITEDLYTFIVSRMNLGSLFPLADLISVLKVSEDPSGLLDAIRILIGMIQELE